MATRLHNLDMLRGGAAFAVMCAHAAILGQEAILPVVSDVPSLLSHLGASSVWLFFVVSGFVISRPFVVRLLAGEQLPSLRSYSAKRTSRIYPLYWVCALSVVLLVGWGSAGSVSKVAHSLLLHNLVPHRSHAFIPVSWTLTLEVLFYIAVPIVAVAARRSSRGRPVSADRLVAFVLVGWGAAVVYLAAIPFAVDSSPDSIWLRGTFPAMVGMFAPGILLAIALSSAPSTRIAAVWSRLANQPSTVACCGLLFCALGATLAAINPTSDVLLASWDVSRHAYAVGYGLIVAWAAMRPRWEFPGVRVVEYLGDISYGVYLIHGTVLILLLDNPSLIPLRRAGIDTYFLHLAFLGGITLVLAAASWRWLESPINQRARSVAARWSHRPAPLVGS